MGFWTNGWNVFDFVVVVIGILDTAYVDLGPMKMLRMMRAFRTFRLFKKVKSLNKIIVSLVHAVPGMMNAFFINALFMFIYAVLAVELFGYAESIHLNCWEKDSPVIANMDGFDKELIANDTEGHFFFLAGEKHQITARGMCWGVEYYSTFGRSLYTLFQILTGDSWSEAVVRPIFQFFDNAFDQFFAGIFFCSFIMLNALVLINVVVAVLLDKMPKDEPEKPEEDHDAEGENSDPDLVTDETEKQQIARMEKDLEEMKSLLDSELNVAEKELDIISKTVASVV